MTNLFSARTPLSRKSDRGWSSPGAAGAWALIASVCLTGCDGAAGGSTADTVPGRSPVNAARQAAGGQPRVGPDGQLVRTTDIRIGGVTVTVEIADTPELRQRGLMFRDSLPEDYGMLFVHSDLTVRSFWMRNTEIPLDIAFIDQNGVITNIEQMEPQSDMSYYSQGPVMYALEMRLGWFADNDVEPGERLEF